MSPGSVGGGPDLDEIKRLIAEGSLRLKVMAPLLILHLWLAVLVVDYHKQPDWAMAVVGLMIAALIVAVSCSVRFANFLLGTRKEQANA